MGWQGREITCYTGMLFRKMFCGKCGHQLKKKGVTYIVIKGDPEFKQSDLKYRMAGMDSIKVTKYIYECPNCGDTITYDEQCLVAKKQKKLHKTILTDEERALLFCSNDNHKQ